tara:strand:- start:293 stop:880 length:588 start_codon:yes stop_codon:yes gene_type:complete
MIFKDYPEFRPNLSPKQVLRMGSFGGTYFRDIYSGVTKKKYKGKQVIKEYPKDWFTNLNIDQKIISSSYDKNINTYKVKCGSSLEDWETKKWIHKQDPYGWFQWYCRFYRGRRTKDDERQIERWNKIAGPNGRFRRNLMNKIIKSGKKYNDKTVSPVIRQVLQHWGYKLTNSHLNSYKKNKKKSQSKKSKKSKKR